ncbi:MAG TPA: ABC transporter ATP-binding protein [Candidatus Saccharimonadales bacterium]|nr:ABC transporter ATP-binding protein [Candidatus Saccharimonadales bacterium]
MSDVIVVKDLAREYHMGDVVVPALRGITLSIAEHSFVAIGGASGSGKSTFMNLLGCLDRPSAGSYTLNGDDMLSVPRAELARVRGRKIGFVFQSFNLLARTSAYDNVELPLLYQHIDSKERRQCVLEALERVGLADRMHHFPSQLSGGQQQRVAIARALVNRPALILGDEPTGNLDTRTGIEIMELFLGLNRQGITVVMVTHEPDIAQYAERNLVFRDGWVVSDTRVLKRRDPKVERAQLDELERALHHEVPS